jgi:hypothetical protein
MMRETLVAALVFAQPFMGAGSTGGTAPVSPSVMATDMCVVDAAGRGTLELLILWRGSPGWVRKGDGGGSGGGSGAGGSMAGGPSPMIRSAWVSQGGVSLSVRFDPAARKVWIQDKEIALDEANVVLVDGVDSPEGPQVVRTLRIDPEYQTTMSPAPYGGRMGRGPQIRPQPVPAQTFIRRSPELVEFLQCDASVPGLQPYEQQVFDMWCSWVRQP